MSSLVNSQMKGFLECLKHVESLRKAKSFEWYDKNEGKQEKMRTDYR